MPPIYSSRTFHSGPDYYTPLRFCLIDECGGFIKGLSLSVRNNVLSWIKVLLYLVSFVIGIILCICVGVLLRNFEGNCILFAQIVWDNTTIWPWSESACDFVLYMNLALAVIFPILMILFSVVALFPKAPHEGYTPTEPLYHRLDGRQDDKRQNSGHFDKWTIQYVYKGMNPILLVCDTLICLLMLCSACVLTTGTSRFCEWLGESMGEMGLSATCLEAQNVVEWDKLRIISGRPHGVNGSNFYALLLTAIICSWTLTCVWVTQLVLQCSLCCRRFSCEIAEEKRRLDRTMIVAQRRSRMTTPSHTPGGRHTPVPIGQAMPASQPVYQTGQRPQQMHPPQGYQPYRMPPPQGYGGPPQGYGGPPQGYGEPPRRTMPPKQYQGNPNPGYPMQSRQGPSVTMKMPSGYKEESMA